MGTLDGVNEHTIPCIHGHSTCIQMGSTHIEQHWGADSSSSFRSTISSIKLTLCNVASLITNTISKDTTTRSIYTKRTRPPLSNVNHTLVYILTYTCIYVHTYIRMYGRYTRTYMEYITSHTVSPHVHTYIHIWVVYWLPTNSDIHMYSVYGTTHAVSHTSTQHMSI